MKILLPQHPSKNCLTILFSLSTINSYSRIFSYQNTCHFLTLVNAEIFSLYFATSGTEMAILQKHLKNSKIRTLPCLVLTYFQLPSLYDIIYRMSNDPVLTLINTLFPDRVREGASETINALESDH